jgi:O-methyltransferase
MLLQMLRSVFSPRQRAEVAPAPEEYAHETLQKLAAVHQKAPMDFHSRLLHGDLRVGDQGLIEFTHGCETSASSIVPPLKVLHRQLATYFLARYYVHCQGLDGLRAECGVFSGMSALVMCRAARSANPGYDGLDLHLLDSFEGLSASTGEDRVATRESSTVASAGSLSADIRIARQTLREFPGVAFHKGWIPGVFGELPDARWSFAHFDVDLYEPTRASLEYFWPRLVRGGVVICDDYGAPLFPGAHRAWDEYFGERKLPYVVLPTGQSVAVKE